MIRYIIVSVVSGILFSILDGVINANPLAQRLYAVYKPIARTSLNPTAGIVIDLVYGFVMAGVFLLLYHSLPGATGLAQRRQLCCAGVVLPRRHVRGIAVGDVHRPCAGIAVFRGRWDWAK